MNKWPSIKVKGNLEKRYFLFQGDIHTSSKPNLRRTDMIWTRWKKNCVLSDFFVEFVSVYSAFTLEYLAYRRELSTIWTSNRCTGYLKVWKLLCLLYFRIFWGRCQSNESVSCTSQKCVFIFISTEFKLHNNTVFHS